MIKPIRSAIFSLRDDPGDDPLGATEEATPAFLTSSRGGRDCLVHRITSHSITLSVSGPVTHGERATIQLPFGFCADGWIDSDKPTTVFRFDQPLDIVDTLARCVAALPEERRRMPRVELRQLVCIRTPTVNLIAFAGDLSPTGISIHTHAALQMGDPVEVEFDGLESIQGEVRWAEHGQVGIAFGEELGWQTLMPWLRRYADRVPRAAAPGADPPPVCAGRGSDSAASDSVPA